MKILLFVVLLLMITMPVAMGHPKILDTYPPTLKSSLSDPVDVKEFQRVFFTVLIGAMVITMTVTVFVVYREDIPIIKNLKG